MQSQRAQGKPEWLQQSLKTQWLKRTLNNWKSLQTLERPEGSVEIGTHRNTMGTGGLEA